MRMSRMVTTVLATALVGAAPLVASPAQAAATGPELVARAVKSVKADTPTWVKAWWTAKSDICAVEVTVKGDDVAIGYPANTATYASFSRGSTLAEGTVDHTAFRVTAGSDTRVQWLDVTVTYTELPDGTLTPWAGNAGVDCAGPEMSKTIMVLLPVRK